MAALDSSDPMLLHSIRLSLNSLNCLLLSMNSTNETLLFDRFLIMYNLCVFTCIIFICVFHCTRVRMSYVLNSYLLTYFLPFYVHYYQQCLSISKTKLMQIIQ